MAENLLANLGDTTALPPLPPAKFRRSDHRYPDQWVDNRCGLTAGVSGLCEDMTQPTQRSSKDKLNASAISGGRLQMNSGGMLTQEGLNKTAPPAVVWSTSPKTEVETFEPPKGSLSSNISNTATGPGAREPISSASVTGTVSYEGEVSCEVPRTISDDVESIAASAELGESPSSSSQTSADSTMNEINEVVQEISTKIQNITVTSERLEMIKKRFSESRPLTVCESDAFDWLADNTQLLYKDPVSAGKKLRTAVGNRTVPVELAVKNRTIRETDMLEQCSFEGRNEITVNELSDLLKRLIKMKIRDVLFEDTGPTVAVSSLKSAP